MPRKSRSSKNKYLVPTVQKALAILELLCSKNRSYTISEISRIFRLPVSSTSALLHTLYDCGYLMRDDRKNFHISMKLLSEATKALDQVELRDVAESELKELTKAIGLASVLSICDGDQMVCVHKIEGTSQIRLAPHIGKRLPLHATATGKAVLAYLPEEEARKKLSSAGLPRLTAHTITSLSMLVKELRRVRAQGYAIDDEEHGVGIRGIGAPVFDHRGNVIAAVGVGGAVFELDENMDKVVAAVKRTAAEVSARVGFRRRTVPAPAAAASSAGGRAAWLRAT